MWQCDKLDYQKGAKGVKNKHCYIHIKTYFSSADKRIGIMICSSTKFIDSSNYRPIKSSLICDQNYLTMTKSPNRVFLPLFSKASPIVTVDNRTNSPSTWLHS